MIWLEGGLGTVLCEIDNSGHLVCTRYELPFYKYKAIGYNLLCGR